MICSIYASLNKVSRILTPWTPAETLSVLLVHLIIAHDTHRHFSRRSRHLPFHTGQLPIGASIHRVPAAASWATSETLAANTAAAQLEDTAQCSSWKGTATRGWVRLEEGEEVQVVESEVEESKNDLV